MVTPTKQSLTELYETDETAWLDAMATLIRAGRFDEIDCVHLAEFLDDNAQRDRWEIYCIMADFLAGLLVWKHHCDKVTPTRRGEILGKHFDLENWLDTPALRKHAEAILHDTYKDAVERASAEADVAPASFPPACPWTVVQLLSEEVLHQ